MAVKDQTPKPLSLLPPIDANYKPKVSVTTLPSTAPISDVLSVLKRDGGVILKDLVSAQELKSIETEIEPWKELKRRDPASGPDAFNTIPSSTVLIPGLVGKSPTMASICENETLEQLRETILKDDFVNKREEHDERNVISPLLSLSIAMNIGFGAPRQRLHRDDGIHAIRHGKGEFRLDRASQFGCLIAGCEVTRENGATMFVPGSHKWDDDHACATPNEVCFAEMSPGSALIFLASCYHGGGHNSVPDSQRTMYCLFFIRGTLRTEENQFLAIPRSKALKMSPKMLELLGYAKPPTTALGVVDNIDPVTDIEGVLERAMA
ncbi:uncharacterized protein Z520_02391 [Fonsecaea multimorphosa CBS 102226]|uniref:Phytanoyl-CoA dioxygenase n=1 Tax=Fonsecaea multimorphosa CBS 102226 TaxID=1442371 RepID=A0A0D2K846_9EURO|nr:uncharacterized protein Z520_02391 [Fonsecaea multimorphosa CBS 102226]KIY02253.1 hypothetical protein Z520_02391 [Fonsecaea multimorphosa CBS 102226]OAL28901.1 hypothetical protein AYO22_02337 [Fonsecaea multimorphosa]